MRNQPGYKQKKDNNQAQNLARTLCPRWVSPGGLNRNCPAVKTVSCIVLYSK